MKRIITLIVLITLSAVSASAQKWTSPLYDRGYAPSVQAGHAFMDEFSGHCWSIETSQGFSFGNGLYVGGGAGIHFMPDFAMNFHDTWMLAAFGDFKYSFMNRKVSPCAGMRAGFYRDIREEGNGLMVRPYVGVDVLRFTLSLAYDKHFMWYQRYNRKYAGWHIQLAYSF